VLVSALAGSGVAASSNGIGAQAAINYPSGVAISNSGTFAVATGSGGNLVLMIDMATSQVSTLAGSGNGAFADGQGTQASFSFPDGVAISPDDSFVIVAESGTSHRIRRIVIATGVVTTLAGNGAGYADGVGTLAKFNIPRGLAISPNGAYVLIADSQNIRVRRLDLKTSAVTTVAGSSQYSYADGIGTNAQFRGVFRLAIDPTGSFALICDYQNNRIRRLEIASLQVTTLAGSSTGGFQDGTGTNAIFNAPNGVSIDPTGTYALIADHSNQCIRRIDISTAQVTTLAGTGVASAINGVGASATFSSPHAISIGVNGTFALVADAGNHRIRRIALTSPPCSVGFYCPSGSSSPTQHACTPGSYCATSGLSSPSGLCSGGFYCGAGSSTATQHLCTSGTYCPIGSSNAIACNPGHYCLAGSSTATQHPCAAGIYCSEPGETMPFGSRFQPNLFTRFYASSWSGSITDVNGPPGLGWAPTLGTPGFYAPIAWQPRDSRAGNFWSFKSISEGFVYSPSNQSTIQFRVSANGGIAIYVGGKPVLVQWQCCLAAGTLSPVVALGAGYSKLTIRYLNSGDGFLNVAFRMAGSENFTTDGTGVFFSSLQQWCVDAVV
jgi:DNA-binding beta-propeller fold protein YncE